MLHDAVFVRALAASVCRALKIDSAPILSRLPLNSAPQLKQDERGINTPFFSPSDTSGTSISELLSKPSSLFVLALVVAGIAVFFLPDMKTSEVPGELASQTVRPSDGRASPQTVQTPVQVFESNPEPVAVLAPLAPAVGGSSTLPLGAGAAARVETPVAKVPVAPSPPVSTIQPVAVASRQMAIPSQTLVAASRPASTPVLPSTGTVIFKARGSTWVKVVDSKGIVQLSKTLAQGEVVGASGAVPLSVIVGRVDATEVEVRGQAFSLTGVSKDNVARFEVK